VAPGSAPAPPETAPTRTYTGGVSILVCVGEGERAPTIPVGGMIWLPFNYNVSNVIMLVSSLALAVGERLSVRGEVSVGFCSRK